MNTELKQGNSKNAEIYKREMMTVSIGSIIIMIVGMGVFFMSYFPGLLNVKIWGFPFPYWYQMTFNWLGIVVIAYVISKLLAKNEMERKNAGEEE